VSDESGKPVARPWESNEDESQLELPSEEDVEQGLSALESGPTSLDGFTDEDYLSATTQEYRGLAESVAAADTQEFPSRRLPLPSLASEPG
jgi:hypothetical protein